MRGPVAVTVAGVVGSLAVVAFVGLVMSTQVSDRSRFARGELRTDVMDRWGAPICQPAPSVLFVESGSVFKTLQPLPLQRQVVRLDATMSYRKRGLVLFSGFDFAFDGQYVARAPGDRDVDVAFVFPVNLEANKVLLSDLVFTVDGVPAPADLAESEGRLVWTGRLAADQERTFAITFRGRGLEQFVYSLDPKLPVRDLTVEVVVHGGTTHDYPEGVISASSVEPRDDGVALTWQHAALESGVPVGLVLPATRSHDRFILAILQRSVAGHLLLCLGLLAAGVALGRLPRLHEWLLLGIGHACLLILLPYLAAYASFWLALPAAVAIVVALLAWYARRVLPGVTWSVLLALLAAACVVPIGAVVLEGHSGLVYTVEIVVLVAMAMVLTTRSAFSAWLARARSLWNGAAAHALGLLLVAIVPAAAQAQSTAASGEVTLPLQELLRLHDAERGAARSAEGARPRPKPPVDATLDELVLAGAVGDDALDVVASVRVTVLARETWASVPVVRVGDAVGVSAMPEEPGIALTIDDGWLRLVAGDAGTFSFHIGLRAVARRDGARRQATLEVGRATFCTLALTTEPGFRLVQPRTNAPVAPVDGRLVATWERVGSPAPAERAKLTEAAAPAIEPAVVAARASTSVTLEGRRFTRLLAELRIGKPEILRFDLPAGEVLEHVYVNGRLVAFAVDQGSLAQSVEPARPKEEKATVELVLSSQDEPWPLTGKLAFELPATPWTVHELTWELRLPEVFTYRWIGGTLEPAEDVPAAAFSHPLPDTGRRLPFRQHLVAGSAPRLQVEHAIDLAGHYHCPR